MKYIYLFVISLFFIQMTGYAEKPIKLLDAYEAKKIEVRAHWNAHNRVFGHNLVIKVVNNQKQKITLVINPGETFLCHSTNRQNQMVVKADTVSILPQDSIVGSLYTVCIGHEKQSPGSSDVFSLVEQEDVGLKDVAQYISNRGYHNTSVAQAAVWSIQGSVPITEIYSTDTVMARGLVQKVSELTNQPPPEKIPAREHHIVVLNGDFNYQAVQPIIVHLGVYDTTGKVVNMLMKNSQLPTGFHTFTYHANEVAPEGTKYLLKMTNDHGEVLYSKILTEQAEASETLSQKIIRPFTLNKGHKDLMLGIYDEDENLIAEIFRYRSWLPGTHYINYTLYHDRKNDSLFYLQLRDRGNKVAWQQTIRKKQDGDDRHPKELLDIELKYPVASKVKGSKCVIYSEFGDEVAIVFQDKKLKPGPNSIDFKLNHTYGKNAKFILQVLGPTRQVLYFKELKQ